jgi:hypothetical protein
MHDALDRGRALPMALALLAALAGAAVATGSIGVSPGEPGRTVEVEARCPTFSWAATPGARGSELVVLRLPAARAEPRGSPNDAHVLSEPRNPVRE